MTINVSTQGEPWFIPKKQIFQHTKPFLRKNHVVDLIITAKLLVNNTEARTWTCTDDSANVGSVHCRCGCGVLGEASSILVSVYLIFTLRLTRYTLFKTMRYCTQRLEWEITIYNSISIGLGSLLDPPHSAALSTTATGSRDHYVLSTSKLYQTKYDWFSFHIGW